MKLFKSKVAVLKSKIAKENLLLLDVEDRNSECMLQRVYDWQEDYDWVDWEEFKDWSYCDRCKGYNKDRCICYAR